MQPIFRVAALAAAALAFIATASPATAANSGALPAPGLVAVAPAPSSDTQVAAPVASAAPAALVVPSAPAQVSPGPFASMFVPAAALASKIVDVRPESAAVARSLDELVAAFATNITPDDEQDCLANAVYFEARSEPIEGQLAVAEVIMNRAASGRYPVTLCGVVTQPAQFSFVRRGRMPLADKGSDAWRKAVAIARIAKERLSRGLAPDILWYHAAYVSPSWGRRLTRATRIGLHIFYS